jgi:putative hydrolase of the HAD superfamily
VAPEIGALLAAAFGQLNLRLDAAQVVHCSRRFFDAAVSGQRLYDDARAILASLRVRGYAVGVVTNSIFSSDLTRTHLGRLGIAGYVDAIVTSADVGFGKPHPAPYHRALAGLRLHPLEAIFVGDRSETDVAGAIAAGIRPVLVDREPRRNHTPGVDVIARLSALNLILGDGPAP